MLTELVVENFAVVERLRLRFHAGLNALTGETGSGKSLIVDALGLLMGGRASADMVRSGADRAFLSGIFEMPSSAELFSLLQDAGIEPEDGELLIEREILSSGKSRAFAGSRPVAASLLREIAPFLGDIHGQHEQQKLFSADAQREMLDEAAAGQDAANAVHEAWVNWRGLIRELEELDRTEQEKLRLADLWNMQRAEIETLELTPGEDAQLENERRVLKNVGRLSDAVTFSYDALSESESSALAQIGQALKRLEDAARIDASLESVVEALRPAQIGVQEASHELRHYLGALEADPNRLEAVESRLAQIEKLKRKYGASIEEILAFLEEVRARLHAVETAGERRAELAASIAEAEARYREAAARLHALREKAARKIEKAVETELASLAMKGTTFRISITVAEPAPHGMDAIAFLVSANVGEQPRPLDKVASGGELSRIALALKTVIASRPAGDAPRTLVFDEVDAGVGGAAAEAVGRRLRRIAAANQVLCVTHLAQIAGFADHHFVVSKRAQSGRTITEVAELEPALRVEEIARMLSGSQLSDEAMRHAEKLLASYRTTAA